MPASASYCLLAASILAGVGDAPPDKLQEQKEAALAMLDAMQAGDYAAAGKRFDATMRKVLPPEKVESTWKAICAQMGTFHKRTEVRTEGGTNFDLVFITCQFDKKTMDLKVAFDKDKQIMGFFMVPPKPKDFPAPPYARRDAFHEEEVVVGKGSEWPLPGTLTIPAGAGPFPALILLHGSGPHDRDETIGPNKPFRDLAWGLATRGVALLRFEKRTKEHGSKFAALKTFTLQDETVDDARAAVALLRAHKAIDPKRIVVAGHSLGAVAVPLVGQQEPELAGIIVLAGNSRPLEDLILDQFNYLFSLKGDLSEDDRKRLDTLKEKVARVKDPKLSADTPKSDLPLGIKVDYWLFLRSYNDVATTAKLRMPVLVLQGERDYQVTMDDFSGWKKGLSGKQNATLKSYPALNHLFMTGTGKSRPAEYDNPGHVAQEVVDDIATWVKGR